MGGLLPRLVPEQPMKDRNSMEVWDRYFARIAKLELPKPEQTEEFLRHIPANGRVLDFGAGTCRWSVAFVRDRGDLLIDSLDQHIDTKHSLKESNNLRINKIKMSFREFKSDKPLYDGVWAMFALFMNQGDFDACLPELFSSLKPGGVIMFSMVSDCYVARELEFHGKSQEAIMDALERVGLKIESWCTKDDLKYGPREQSGIPTYIVCAKKP